jgi:hypothetical protein
MDVFGNCIDGQHLGLLATCRSIHAETHMLSFTPNVFSFDTLSVFHNTVLHLLPFQRELITKVVIPQPLDGPVYSIIGEMIDKNYPKLSDLLPDVQTVQIARPRVEVSGNSRIHYITALVAQQGGRFQRWKVEERVGVTRRG